MFRSLFDVVLFIFVIYPSLYLSLFLDFCWLADVKRRVGISKLLAVDCLPGEFFQDHRIISPLLMVATGSLQ